MSSGSSSLQPVSIVSITIGFVSFAFTLAIWLHAFWDAFTTLSEAPFQVKDSLSVLRQSLYEEREHLKRVRGRRGSSPGTRRGVSKGMYTEQGPLRIINDTVKDLIRKFKQLEHPFLIPPHSGTEKELEWSFNATQQYYNCDLLHRLIWLRTKSPIMSISEQLNALQIRRIAVELTETHLLVADVMRELRGLDDRVHHIEDSMMLLRAA